MRLPRLQIRDCCVHVTHRCQQRQFPLQFAIDRGLYRRRLLQAWRGFRHLRVLDCTITSNHVHRLPWTVLLDLWPAMTHRKH